MYIILPFHIPPFLIFTLSLIAGILWQAFNSLLILPLIVGVAVALAISGLISSRELFAQVYRLACLALLFFFAGALRYYQQVSSYKELTQQLNLCKADIQATLEDAEKTSNRQQPYAHTLKINRLTIKGHNSQNAQGKLIKLYTPMPLSANVGDTLEVKDIFFRPSTNASYQKYLFKEGYAATVFMKNPRYSVLKRGQSLRELIKRWLSFHRMHVAESLKNKMSAQTYTLFCPLFLGKKPDSLNNMSSMRKYFQAWGITHYLARSGLHVVIFALICGIIMSYIPCHFSIKQLLIIALTAIYSLLSWSSVSFIRALLTYALYKTCMLLNIAIHPLHVLCLACCCILLTNPLQLFFLDFQLSFVLTFGLAWLNHTKR